MPNIKSVFYYLFFLYARIYAFVSNSFSKKEEMFTILSENVDLKEIFTGGAFVKKRYTFHVSGNPPQTYVIKQQGGHMDEILLELNEQYKFGEGVGGQRKTYKLYFIDRFTWMSPFFGDIRNGDNLNFLVSLSFHEYKVKDITSYNYAKRKEKYEQPKIEEDYPAERIYSCDEILFKKYSPFLDMWSNRKSGDIDRKKMCSEISKEFLKDYMADSGYPIFALVSGSSDVEIIKL